MDSQTDFAPSRVVMPARWVEAGYAGFAGRMRLRRRFGIPRRLDDFERVWLTCEGADDHARVSLNGIELGELTSVPVEWNVTQLLQSRNELVIEAQSSSDRGGLWGEVALEIRCWAYLKAIEIDARRTNVGHLTVTGLVVGPYPDPLELYILHNGKTVDYQVCRSSGEGTPFRSISSVELAADPVPPNVRPPELRIDLVQVSAIWHRIDREQLEWKPFDRFD